MNHFRHINGNTISKERVAQGQPYGNVSFSKNASIKDYQENQLYLEVIKKEELSDHQKHVLDEEKVDHFKRQVIIKYKAVDLIDEQLIQSKKMRAREKKCATCTFKDVTYQCGPLDILNLMFREREMVSKKETDVSIRALDNKSYKHTKLQFTKLIDLMIETLNKSQQQYWTEIK